MYLAYWQFDTTGVNDFQLVNNTDGLYPKNTSFKYPKVGQTNSACRIGIVSAQGGSTVWLQAMGDPRDSYIPQMEWAPNSPLVRNTDALSARTPTGRLSDQALTKRLASVGMAAVTTCSTFSAKVNSSSSRTFCGKSSKSFSLPCGRIT